MNKTTEQIKRIMEAGASVTVSSAKTTDQLISLAKVAAKNNVRLTIINAGKKTTEQLISIAKAGGGQVEVVF